MAEQKGRLPRRRYVAAPGALFSLSRGSRGSAASEHAWNQADLSELIVHKR